MINKPKKDDEEAWLDFVSNPKTVHIAVVDAKNRTGAVSVMRDKAKRHFEILFKVFPELTNRNNDF